MANLKVMPACPFDSTPVPSSETFPPISMDADTVTSVNFADAVAFAAAASSTLPISFTNSVISVESLSRAMLSRKNSPPQIEPPASTTTLISFAASVIFPPTEFSVWLTVETINETNNVVSPL